MSIHRPTVQQLTTPGAPTWPEPVPAPKFVAKAVEAVPPWVWKGRVPALDGLRAISILIVIGFHTDIIYGKSWPRWVGLITIHGSVGVDVFFVISGFLITLLLLRERLAKTKVSLLNFYVRRTLRIWPAYIVFVLVMFILSSQGVIEQVSNRNWATALTYSMSVAPPPPGLRDQPAVWPIGHLWSLSVEELFCLTWPLMFVVLTPRVLVRVVLLYIASCPMLR
jgi:peptidoglycan/LPS O-acetylase OafA/YrhL